MPCSDCLCKYEWDELSGSYELIENDCSLCGTCYCPSPPSAYQGDILVYYCTDASSTSSTSTSTTTAEPTTTTESATTSTTSTSTTSSSTTTTEPTTTTSTTTTPYPGGPVRGCTGVCHFDYDPTRDQPFKLTFNSCSWGCFCDTKALDLQLYLYPGHIIYVPCVHIWPYCSDNHCVIAKTAGGTAAEVILDNCRDIGCNCPIPEDDPLLGLSASEQVEIRTCVPVRGKCLWWCNEGTGWEWVNLSSEHCSMCERPTISCLDAGGIFVGDCIESSSGCHNFVIYKLQLFVDNESGTTSQDWVPIWGDRTCSAEDEARIRGYLSYHNSIENVGEKFALICPEENSCSTSRCVYRCEYNSVTDLYEAVAILNECDKGDDCLCACDTAFCNNCVDPNIYFVTKCISEYDKVVPANIYSMLCSYTCSYDLQRYVPSQNTSFYISGESGDRFCLDLSNVPCDPTKDFQPLYTPIYYKLKNLNDCEKSRCAYTCINGDWVLVSECVRKFKTGPNEEDFVFLETNCDCPTPSYTCQECTPENPTSYVWLQCNAPTTTSTSSTTTTPGPSTTSTTRPPITTTTQRPECFDHNCTYRCNGTEWELIINTQEPCTCAPPNLPCNYDNICQEITIPPAYNPPPPPPPIDFCTSSYCRWYCTYINGAFTWLNVQDCPVGCYCINPMTECNKDNVCTYTAKHCVSIQPPELTCGYCIYTCINNRYIATDFYCTEDCICPNLDIYCTDGDRISWPCTNPNTTTTTMGPTTTTSAPTTTTTAGPTTTTTTGPATTTTTYLPPCGYCKYLGVSSGLAIIEDNCTGTCTCPEFITTNSERDKYYYINCSEEGGELLRLTDSLKIILEPVSPTVTIIEITTTTEEPTTTTTTEAPCEGLCLYIWGGSFWIKLFDSCSCNCWPPEESFGEFGEIYEGQCKKDPYELPTLTTPTWMPEVIITTTTTTEEPPPTYPHGYCMYKCNFADIYFLYLSECDEDYSCPDWIQLACEPGEIMYMPCSLSGSPFVEFGEEPIGTIEMTMNLITVIAETLTTTTTTNP